MRLGTPMMTIFLIRKPDGRYKIIIGDIIRFLPGADKDKTVKDLTIEWMKSFERVIRQYPEQWAWMHDRWKTKPEDILKKKVKEK